MYLIAEMHRTNEEINPPKEGKFLLREGASFLRAESNSSAPKQFP